MLTSLLLNLRAYVSHNQRQSSSTDRMNNSDFWRGKSFRIWQLGNPRTIWNEALGCLLPKSVRKPLRDLAADFKIESQTVAMVNGWNKKKLLWANLGQPLGVVAFLGRHRRHPRGDLGKDKKFQSCTFGQPFWLFWFSKLQDWSKRYLKEDVEAKP